MLWYSTRKNQHYSVTQIQSSKQQLMIIIMYLYYVSPKVHCALK